MYNCSSALGFIAMLIALKIFAPDIFVLAVEIVTKVLVTVNQGLDGMSSGQMPL